MKITKMKMMLWLMGVLAICLTTSCKDDDDTAPNEVPAKYLVTTTIKNANGMSGSSFLKMLPDFSGTINNSNSIPISFGTGVGVRGNDIYVFPTFGKDGDFFFFKYEYKGTTLLKESKKIALPPNSGASNITIVNSEKIYVPAYGIGKVYIINPKTMDRIGEIELSQYAHGDNNPEPGNGIIRDGFYYLPLDQAGSDYMPYPDYRQVDVLIIDTETDNVIKVISENTSNLSFPTRPMDNCKGMIYIDENNDIYIACVGNFGFDPNYKNSGFVCIPAGQTDFDTSKSWDISDVNIEGTEYQIGDSTAYYKPATVYNCKYIGNGKLIAYVGIVELLDPSSPYTTKNNMAVIIDQNAKTIKQIKEIPISDGHTNCIYKYQDVYIIGSYGTDKIGFFSYNPQTEEVIHVVTTEGNPTGFHYFE